jgi:AcrR family transcriptional regulator
MRLEPEARREAILAGARRALLRGGLERTTMDEVAAAAGVAKGTPYLYFSSKAELVAAVRRQYGEELVRHAGGLLEPGAPPDEPAAERLERFAASIFDFAVKNQQLHHLLFHETGASEEEQLQPVVDIVARFLEDAMAAGELRPGEPRFLASVVVSGAHAAMMPSLHQAAPDRTAFVALTRDLIDRLFR